MKKYLAALAGMAFLAVTAGGAYAGTADDKVPVSATVKAVCKVTSVGAIAFGDVDAVAHEGGKNAAITAPEIYCTKGASVKVNDDGGERNDYTMTDGTNMLTYSVSYTKDPTPITGQGMGTSIGSATYLNLTASLAGKALDNVPAGTYTDNLTLTVTY
jgi:spore coat protein U-like protein